jgi:hypothetical protein
VNQREIEDAVASYFIPSQMNNPMPRDRVIEVLMAAGRRAIYRDENLAGTEGGSGEADTQTGVHGPRAESSRPGQDLSDERRAA